MTRQIKLQHYIKFIFLISLTTLLFACQKEHIELIYYPEVSSELCPYFQSFEKEAAKRGLIINLKNSAIKGKIVDLNNGIVGVCSKHLTKEILIDRNFWETSSELKKELIIFHELGHCYLNKIHNNQKEANGTCKSIMRNGFSGCIDFYTHKTKADLLDEFFIE